MRQLTLNITAQLNSLRAEKEAFEQTFIISTILLLLLVLYFLHYLYLLTCKIQWNQIIYGPAIFLYTYHIGNWSKTHMTLNTLKKVTKDLKLKHKLKDALNLASESSKKLKLKLIPAEIYVQPPGVMYYLYFMLCMFHIIGDQCCVNCQLCRE